jgi:hypothetical protein
VSTTVHVPVARNVMVEPFEPLEVQTVGVVVVNDTGRPEDAVADATNGDCANVLFDSLLKVIVCDTFVTVKLRLTGWAGL